MDGSLPLPASIDQPVARRVLSDDALAAIRTLCERYQVARLDVFGSITTGMFDETRSDIDVLVEFPPFAKPAGRADAFFGLHEALEALFARRVDLLTDASVKNPFLRRSIERSRRRLFPLAVS